MHSIMQQASTFTVAKAEQALRIKQSVEYSRVDPDSRWFFADAIPGGGCGSKAKELLDLSSFHSVTALTVYDSFLGQIFTDGYVLRRLRMRSRRTMRGPSIEQSRYTHLAGGFTFAAVSWRRRQSAVTCQECEQGQRCQKCNKTSTMTIQIRERLESLRLWSRLLIHLYPCWGQEAITALIASTAG